LVQGLAILSDARGASPQAGPDRLTGGRRLKHDGWEQTQEDREWYAFAEEGVLARKAGLRAQPDPVPPWEWRHR